MTKTTQELTTELMTLDGITKDKAEAICSWLEGVVAFEINQAVSPSEN